MRYMKIRAFWISVFALSAWFFSGTVAAAGCVANPDISSELVSPYGGSALSCPSGYSECIIDDVFDGAECTTLINEDGSVSTIKITVGSDNFLSWTSFDANGNPDVIGAAGVDAVFRENGTGSNGCLWSYGTDQVTAEANFLKNNGSYMPTRNIAFCSDMKQEFTASPPPPPAEVEQCLIDAGESKEIHGVTFSCPGVDTGETRTIIVAEITTDCVEVTPVTSPPTYECDSVPGFGFLDADGNIDFNNVCQCVGPLVTGEIITPVFPVLQTECDPDPANTEEGCEVGAGSEVPVDVTIQNPTCFTIGGFRRCF